MWRAGSGRGGRSGNARHIALATLLTVVASACSNEVNREGSATPLATDPSGSVLLPTTLGTSGTPDNPTSSVAPGIATVGSDAPVTAPTSTLAVVPSTLTWASAGKGLEQTRLQVPVDYNNPDGATMDLYLLRLPASDPDAKIGTLLVNPGGPGYPGSELARYAETYFDPALRKYFDIVGWDPRGTGKSEPAIDCTEDYDYFFTEVDSTPDDDSDRQLIVDRATKFAQDCQDVNPDLLPYIGTNNSARDMNQIRLALGEDQISYFGLSYGSELGATWMTLFPETVRAAVLDGASDPTASSVDSGVQQYAGFESSLNAFFDWCTQNNCPFVKDGEDPATVFEQLAADIDETPIQGEEGRPLVTRDVLVGAVVEAMYSDKFWNALARSLADARNGNGAGLMALYDKYYQRKPSGEYPNMLEAFMVISCMDESERQTVEESDATAAQYHEAAPLLFPEGALPGYTCNFFPAASDPRIDVTGAGAGPIVVVGTTGDPATPLASSKAMADTLEEGIFVSVDANQHTGYKANRCIVDLVNNYLIDLTVPDDGTFCR